MPPKNKKAAASATQPTKGDDSEKSKSDSQSDGSTRIKNRRKRRQHQPQVLNSDYFHGILPREDVSMLLRNDGDFLLRSMIPEKDPAGDPQIILSVYFHGKIKNSIIKEVYDKKKQLKYKLGDQSFPTISALIEMYHMRKVRLKMNDDEVVLETPIRRKPWELRHHMVTFGTKKKDKLGEGAFGRVYKGTLKRTPSEVPIVVAIKELWNASPEACAEIWREARIMRDYDHPHITKLYGVCNDKEPFLLITEFVAHGSLESYLRKNPSLEKLGKKKRIQMLLEGAMGIQYLHEKGTIHRDIGARNFLVDDVVKVADFGLARKVKKDGYKIDKDGDCNLRWIAPDALQTGIVDARTDVYAFGITMWEVFKVPYTIPYEEWDGEQVYTNVIEKGFRLKPTPEMPKAVGKLMQDCFGKPETRPDFKSLVICLRALVKNPDEQLAHGL